MVANKAMGAAPYLIEHGKNGFLYRNSRAQELVTCVKKLLDDAKLRERLGRAAYHTISEEWNGNVAADRVYKLAEDLLAGRKPEVYKRGPLSKV